MVITSGMIAYGSMLAAKQIGAWYREYQNNKNNKKKK